MAIALFEYSTSAVGGGVPIEAKKCMALDLSATIGGCNSFDGLGGFEEGDDDN